MSRPKHRVKAPGAYFVTAETWQRRQLFIHEATVSIFLDTLMGYREKRFYLLHDFVAMADHFHAILTPDPDVSLEKAMQMIKGGSSRRIGQHLRAQFPVWQAGFHEHWIRSQEDYERCKQYLEQNPVKARLAMSPREHPYSSANGRFILDPYRHISGAKAPADSAS